MSEVSLSSVAFTSTGSFSDAEGPAPHAETRAEEPMPHRGVTPLPLKTAALRSIQERLGIAPRETVAMGDDLPDLSLRPCVGFLAAPANARPEVLTRADENPNDFEAIKLASDVEVASGRFVEGFARLIAFIKANPGDVRKAAKDHLFTLFSVVPGDDPALIKARRDLASALF